MASYDPSNLDISLKEYLLSLIEERERKYRHQFERIDQRLEEAKRNARESLTETNAHQQIIERKLDAAIAQAQLAEGRRIGITLAWGVVMAVLGVVITVLFHWF